MPGMVHRMPVFKWLWTAGLTLGWLAGSGVEPARAASAPAASTRPAAAPAPPIDKKQEEALLKAAGADFAIKRTPHFVVAYDANRALTDELVTRLEDTYRAIYRFIDTVGIEAHRPPRRLEVIFFNDREGYDRYGATLRFPSQGTFGVYHEPTNRSAFFNVYNDPQLLRLHADISAARTNLENLNRTLGSLRGNQPVVVTYGDGRQETLSKSQVKRRIESAQRDLRLLDGKRTNYSDRVNRATVQHEAAHQVLFNAGVHVRQGFNPKWLIEGLACLFETPPTEQGTGIAVTNQLRLRDFRASVAGEGEKRLLTGDDFLAAIDEGRFPDPRTLISDPRIFDEREERGAAAYAMTWSLAHYLQRTRPKPLAAYIKAIAGRKANQAVTPDQELALFEKHFGRLDDAFVRQWGGYILQLGFRPPPGF